ncbi:MAG TPA: fibronectin type III domain-containing protein, partial [Candidatus Polarisedimenticolaceae bacterium]|nr:fibronectin type III domain-containing protein [Candidatus Polarisedimenticolaceae bacterium]
LLEPTIRRVRWTEESRDGIASLRADRRRVGMGWVRLPGGRREVVLERALVSREVSGEWIAERLEHRWIDPRFGIVALIGGPVDTDGRRRPGAEHVVYTEEVGRGPAGLRVYDFMMDLPVFSRLSYGYDRKGACTVGGNPCIDDGDCTAGSGDICTIPVSLLTPDAHATIGELIAAGSWDFSANDFDQQRYELAATISPVDAAETCSYDKCGFTRPGVKLGRQDKNFVEPAEVDITTTVTEREDRTDGGGQQTDVTLWLRAGVNKEGQTGSLGQGESRICYVDDGRTEVPLWRFPHQDPSGWFWQLGDSWSSDSNLATPELDPFLCENDIFVHTCPNSCGLFCPNYIAACDGYSGTQGSAVIGEGPVTLPSGHTFHSLLVRNVAEFCVFIGSSCASPVFRVRTVVYLWEVPWLGTVARLTSAQNVADYTSWTTVEETDLKFGLFPPRSLTIGAVTDESIELSWDPGLDTHRIDAFRVYWSTIAGSYDPATSVIQPAASGHSAVIGGLEPATEYFFTVTAISEFTNPATSQTTTYESLMLPMTAPGVPQPVPIEVSATTTGAGCAPTTEVGGVVVDRGPGADIEICWSSVVDDCLDGYQILGADSPESPDDFTPVVEDTGLVNCAIVPPSRSYFLVVAKGAGGNGPWGHYGR